MNVAPPADGQPTMQPDMPPPPNGFTTWVRRLFSVGCLFAFFYLLISDALGQVREIPFQTYILLASCVIFSTQAGFGALEALLKYLGGNR